LAAELATRLPEDETVTLFAETDWEEEPVLPDTVLVERAVL
jgi:hypothetical protein